MLNKFNVCAHLGCIFTFLKKCDSQKIIFFHFTQNYVLIPIDWVFLAVLTYLCVYISFKKPYFEYANRILMVKKMEAPLVFTSTIPFYERIFKNYDDSNKISIFIIWLKNDLFLKIMIYVN